MNELSEIEVGEKEAKEDGEREEGESLLLSHLLSSLRSIYFNQRLSELVTYRLMVLAVLCPIVSVDVDDVAGGGGGGGGGTGSLAASDDNMQRVHNKFDCRISMLVHIVNPARSCGKRKLKPQFTLSRVRLFLHQVSQL